MSRHGSAMLKINTHYAVVEWYFSGNPGTGKTSGGRAIAKDLLGDAFANNFHVFNASDDRGIGFVRDRLKSLAEQKAVGHDFKVILLDEADGLTKDAQDAMRQLIEETGTHVLWILTCNRIGRIIPALRSRLPAYSFNPLEIGDAEGFLGRVIDEENFPDAWVAALPSLITKYKGDMRACLKAMQTIDPTDEDALINLTLTDFEPAQSYYKGILADTDLIGGAESLVNTHGMSRDEIIEGYAPSHPLGIQRRYGGHRYGDEAPYDTGTVGGKKPRLDSQ